MSNDETSDIILEQPTKKSDTGLVFYRRCYVNALPFNVGNNILLRDEGKDKLGYLLKIYCRTKGNERALVRWYYNDSDLQNEEQHCEHEIFATSYTGKVAVSAIRRMVHVIFTPHREGVPSTVPENVYYVYRYFDHDKQTLVTHKEQLLKVRYMPKPEPDSAGSALTSTAKQNADVVTPKVIKLSVPYPEVNPNYYKVCTINKVKYKIGDCVLLIERDSSSIRRILHFTYNQEKVPIAMGQFIYYQNEVTLTSEQRADLHYQELLASNWQSELLILNIKRKIVVLHQNIFQSVPANAHKTVYFLKRYYDPFKKKIYPMLEPLTRSDFSIIPEPAQECTVVALLETQTDTVDGREYYKTCRLAEDVFEIGDYVSLQNGSVFVRVMRLYYNNTKKAVMDINRLYTPRHVPSAARHLLDSHLLCSAEVYHEVECVLFFERIHTVFSSEDDVNIYDDTYIVGDYFCPSSKRLYTLVNPPYELSICEIPEPGEPLESSYPSSSSENSEFDASPVVKKKTRTPRRSKGKAEDTPDEDTPTRLSKQNEQKAKRARDKEEAKIKADAEKEAKLAKFREYHKKEYELISVLQTRRIQLSEVVSENQYTWAQVDNTLARVGECVFVKLVEGIQMGRIVSIYRDEEDVLRLKMYRFYLEEEMFVTKRESTTIHTNEVFATDFIIYALLCQLDETVDVVYLKKRAKLPPQKEIPKGRLYVRRYYHPVRQLLRTLKCPLDADDLSIVPQPYPPITSVSGENKALNKAPRYCVPRPSSPDTVPQTSSNTTRTLPNTPRANNGLSPKSQNSKKLKNSKIEAKLSPSPKRQKVDVNVQSTPKIANVAKNVFQTFSLSPKLTSVKQTSSPIKHTITGNKDPKPLKAEIKSESLAPQSKEVLETQRVKPNVEEITPSSSTEANPSQDYKIMIVSEMAGDGGNMTVLPNNMISFSISETPQTSDQMKTISLNTDGEDAVQIIPHTTKPSASIEIVAQPTIEIVPATAHPYNEICVAVPDTPNTSQAVSQQSEDADTPSPNVDKPLQPPLHSSVRPRVVVETLPSHPENISHVKILPKSDQLSDNENAGRSKNLQTPPITKPALLHDKAAPLTSKTTGLQKVQEEDPKQPVEISVSNSIIQNTVEISLPSKRPPQFNSSQIQIVSKDLSQIQIISDSSSIQIVQPDKQNTTNVKQAKPFLPTIISSAQDLDSSLTVDISHGGDGSIMIAAADSAAQTATLEDSYTEGGRIFYRKCHFKDETIRQGDTVYIRCDDRTNESWKLGRTMQFYHAAYPAVRILWFYVVEEMVTSRTERAGIHPQEVFASRCYDEIEISSIESIVNVVFLQKCEGFPRDIPDNTLYCRRFYDPYRHTIRPLKTRLSATDLSILPEPLSKRPRDSISQQVKVNSPSAHSLKKPKPDHVASPIRPCTPVSSVTSSDNDMTSASSEPIRSQENTHVTPRPVHDSKRASEDSSQTEKLGEGTEKNIKMDSKLDSSKPQETDACRESDSKSKRESLAEYATNPPKTTKLYFSDVL